MVKNPWVLIIQKFTNSMDRWIQKIEPNLQKWLLQIAYEMSGSRFKWISWSQVEIVLKWNSCNEKEIRPLYYPSYIIE